MFSDEIAKQYRGELQSMTEDAQYHTVASYTVDKNMYPNNLIPFIDKHLAYLKTHQNLDPSQYMANLRILTRIR